MATEDKMEKIRLPQFNGNDFAVWKAKVRALLTSYDLEQHLTADGPPPSRKIRVKQADQAIVEQIDAEREAERKRFIHQDQRVKAWLLIALDDKHASLVLRCQSAKEIWETLNSLHGQKSAVNKFNAGAEFFETRMKKNESVRSYITRVEQAFRKMKACGVNLTEEELLTIRIVCGLSEDYMGFITMWNGLDSDKQTMNELNERLGAEEQLVTRFKGRVVIEDDGNSTPAIAAMAEVKKKRTPEEMEKLKKRTRCRNCGEKGHWKSECPLLKEQDAAQIATSVASTSRARATAV